jgi:hypothetical protein
LTRRDTAGEINNNSKKDRELFEKALAFKIMLIIIIKVKKIFD